MGIYKQIKNSIANLLLKRELKSLHLIRNGNKFNFGEIKTIGILFDASNSEDFELVKRYIIYLREYNKRVKAIGFYTARKVPPTMYSKLEFDFISRKELTFIGTPSGMVVKNFIQEEYDLLIDLNIYNHFPLKYIATLSKAKFKVGKYEQEHTEMYDMMINIKDSKTIKYLLSQIDTYVMMLNKAS